MGDEENKTLWCGNLADQVTEELLYELFLQAGPLEKVRIAKDRDGRQKNFAFITYRHEVSVPFAINVFRGSALFNRTLYMQTKSRAVLPPPIRFYGPGNINLQSQGGVQQYPDITEHLRDIPMCHQSQKELSDHLIVASLQGNWSHRHNPHAAQDISHGRNDYRYRDNKRDNSYHNRNNRNWRDRRSRRSPRRH